MKVGWLVEDPGYLGGAELTEREFRQAVPEGVEIVLCPRGEVTPDLDVYVCQNVPHYTMDDLAPLRGKRIVKYVHDQWPVTKPGVREWILDHAELIFCSPLHRRMFVREYPDWTVTHVIPPPLDLVAFKAPRQSRKRKRGACTIAQWRNPGKGAHLVEEWAEQYGPVDLYGNGRYMPAGLDYRGPLEPEKVAQTLWEYETFVFLPVELEPFCRTVAEAWAAGCKVVTNDLVGARHYIESDPDALTTAADDFWKVVLGG